MSQEELELITGEASDGSTQLIILEVFCDKWVCFPFKEESLQFILRKAFFKLSKVRTFLLSLTFGEEMAALTFTSLFCLPFVHFFWCSLLKSNFVVS